MSADFFIIVALVTQKYSKKKELPCSKISIFKVRRNAKVLKKFGRTRGINGNNLQKEDVQVLDLSKMIAY
jgi:hypothetical protein